MKINQIGTVWEAIEAGKSKQPSRSQPHQHNIALTARKRLLQADEIVGMYIARAGLSPAGFEEWLQAKTILSVSDMHDDGAPANVRKSAFMRGYLSEIARK